jgi:L-aminopeptidase/D-esterase-like protein
MPQIPGKMAPLGTPPNPHRTTLSGLPRARSLGLSFRGRPGPWNAITDVPGIEAGYQTLIHRDNVRTGVIAIHPRGKANPGDPVAAGFHSQNGNGEMTGVSWIEEPGTFSGPRLCAAPTQAAARTAARTAAQAPASTAPPPGAGSVIAVVATDAPLFPSQCKAFARRVASGLARTGTSDSHFSRDLFPAFSTANPGGITPGNSRRKADRDHDRHYDQRTFIPWGYLDPFYEAVVQETEGPCSTP